MLKKIICDKFIENEIVFHNGLNVVLGDDIASFHWENNSLNDYRFYFWRK